ncbi:hypothetical protein CL629_00175 [bacterium]|nr:hypothetical protein [bacterium]|tara:strand:+ start:3997 stop:4884 length:888 start_codon:yes stop_codon:yes gene_type:complete
MTIIIQTIFKKLKKRKTETGIFVISLIILNILLIAHIIQLKQDKNLLQIYFLSVGQGDSELIILPGGAKILIDGGPSNKKVLQELSKILSPFDRKIDLISTSHPQQDHIGGLPEIIERFKTSALISNGVENTIGAYKALNETTEKHKLQNITLAQGDKIKYKDSRITVVHPTHKTVEKDVNESSLVLLLESASTTTLFTGDISKSIEKNLTRFGLVNEIDILKIAHHGSKNSSDKTFLKQTSPKIAVIEVGKNSYGHPASVTLKNLEALRTKIYNTNTQGTIKITSNGKSLKIYK